MQIRPFSGIRLESFSILARILPFPGTRPGSAIFRYSHGSDLFRYLPREFFDNRTDFTFSRYSPGFYNFSVLTHIRPFSGTRTYSTRSRYSPGFYQFSLLTQIRPFSGTCRECFSIVARTLPFPGTRSDSTDFRYSHRFDPFSVLAAKVFRYSHGFYLSRYLPGFCQFSVLTHIRPFSGTRQESFSILVGILRFPGTRPDSTNFRYSHRFDPFQVLAEKFFRYSHGFYLFPILAWFLP